MEEDANADADPGPPPSAVLVPDDRPAPPVPVEAGVRPGAKTAAANPLHPPAAPRHHVLFWEDVTCPDCNRICGQFKFSPGPGRREGSDPPTWIIRVREEDGSWPSKGHCFHRRVAHLVSEEYPKPQPITGTSQEHHRSIQLSNTAHCDRKGQSINGFLPSH